MYDIGRIIVAFVCSSIAHGALRLSYRLFRERKKRAKKGVKAWSDVPNATEWLENLRGGNA